MLLWRKVLEMSNWCAGQFFLATSVSTMQIVAGFRTSENVSWKSMTGR